MMNIRKYIFVGLMIIVVVSCKAKHEKYTYYDNGQIHEKFVFQTKADKKAMQNYIGTMYYENGNIKCGMIKKNGLTEGDYLTYYENGRISSVTMYNNDTINGIFRSFSEDGNIVEESLYLKGSHLIKMKTFYSGSKTVCVFYYMGNKQEEDIGRIVYKKSGELDADSSFYYQTAGQDTISVGEDYSLDITIYTFNIRNYIKEATFGDFNKTFEINDSSKFVFLKSDDNHLHYSYKPKKTGHNLIIGKLYVKNLPNSSEELDRDFIFFKDFYVKQREK